MIEGKWLYPRLPRTSAEELLETLRDTEPGQCAKLAGIAHPMAAPAPTGGTPVSDRHLRELRSVVLREFEEEMQQPLQGGNEAAVDARFGRLLHRHLQIITSDAAHEGVWSFLALVLLPDLAAWRFPSYHPARFLGTHRNVFRRTWWRQHVLGDIMQRAEASGRRPLGEDELVGIFERSRMARSHELARAIARYILALDVSNRSDFARDLAKRIRRRMAYINVDVLTREQVEAFVSQAGDAATAVQWESADTVDSRHAADSVAPDIPSTPPKKQPSLDDAKTIISGITGASTTERFLKVLERLYARHQDEFHRVLSIRGSSRVYFSRSQEEIMSSGTQTRPVQIGDSPYFVVTGTPARRKQIILRRVLQVLGYGKDAAREILAAL